MRETSILFHNPDSFTELQKLNFYCMDHIKTMKSSVSRDQNITPSDFEKAHFEQEIGQKR